MQWTASLHPPWHPVVPQTAVTTREPDTLPDAQGGLYRLGAVLSLSHFTFPKTIFVIEIFPIAFM